jgi:SAM-dependent methyltransferase
MFIGMPGLSTASIKIGDFTQSLPFEGPFDLVVDRASVTHNATAAIRRAVELVFSQLRSGGKLIGIDWFSAAHPDAGLGRAIDVNTRTDVKDGQFEGVGIVHFSDRGHLSDLLGTAGFAIERLEHKLVERMVPADGGSLATWNFVAVRP